MSNRATRRALAERFRGYSVTIDCPTCGATLGASFVLERGEPDPAVTFLHLLDGTHEPVIGGNSNAARARREGHVVARVDKRLDA